MRVTVKVWCQGASEPGYCAPVIVDIENQRRLLIWDAEKLNCLEPDTGERLWSTTKPVTTGGKPASCGTAFIVKNENRFLLANEKGELIIAEMDRDGFREMSRTKLVDPIGAAFGRSVVWSHPAFANKSIYWRNDKEIRCYSLANE